MALLGERTCAEKHDDAKGGKPGNRQQKNVDGVALHFENVASRMAAGLRQRFLMPQFFLAGIFSFCPI